MKEFEKDLFINKKKMGFGFHTRNLWILGIGFRFRARFLGGCGCGYETQTLMDLTTIYIVFM